VRRAPEFARMLRVDYRPELAMTASLRIMIAPFKRRWVCAMKSNADRDGAKFKSRVRDRSVGNSFLTQRAQRTQRRKAERYCRSERVRRRYQTVMRMMETRRMSVEMR